MTIAIIFACAMATIAIILVIFLSQRVLSLHGSLDKNERSLSQIATAQENTMEALRAHLIEEMEEKNKAQVRISDTNALFDALASCFDSPVPSQPNENPPKASPN